MWIVLIDMRDVNGKIVPMLSDDEYTMRIFATFGDAEEAILSTNAAGSYPISYVNMDE